MADGEALNAFDTALPIIIEEALYAARVDAWASAIADKITAALPDEARDAGLHFEWR